MGKTNEIEVATIVIDETTILEFYKTSDDRIAIPITFDNLR